MSDFRKGDKVVWNSSQGAVEGEVVRKLTSPIDIKGHHVAASRAEPEYLVRSDRTGAEAAHRAESLRRR